MYTRASLIKLPCRERGREKKEKTVFVSIIARERNGSIVRPERPADKCGSAVQIAERLNAGVVLAPG